MKSIFEQSTRDELISRIQRIDGQTKEQWGKMKLAQMLQHCLLWDEMVQGRVHCKRMFMGRIFGKLALSSILKDDKPLGRNSPTAPELVVKETSADIARLKNRWTNSIEAYSAYNATFFIHPFFGKTTKEQIGWLAYKHADHHLRQFGV